MSAVLVVDVGNTSTCVALWSGRGISRLQRVDSRLRERGPIHRAVKAVAMGQRLRGAALCSVVPALNRLWIPELADATESKPVVVGHKLNLGVTVVYPKPETIGADRLANACGAMAMFGTPVVVADFGTALTFDVVSREGAYIGGVIAPGVSLMSDYLAEKTALLPEIELRGRYGRVGRSTVEAMRIGARVGYRGMVREIVRHLEDGIGPFKLCATGGYARLALEGLDMPFVIDPDLTLKGIGRIYELNSNEARR